MGLNKQKKTKEHNGSTLLIFHKEKIVISQYLENGQRLKILKIDQTTSNKSEHIT